MICAAWLFELHYNLSDVCGYKQHMPNCLDCQHEKTRATLTCRRISSHAYGHGLHLQVVPFFGSSLMWVPFHTQPQGLHVVGTSCSMHKPQIPKQQQTNICCLIWHHCIAILVSLAGVALSHVCAVTRSGATPTSLYTELLVTAKDCPDTRPPIIT